MKMFKKSIAMLLTVLMLVSVMAVAGISASAEEGAEEPTTPSETTVYFVNSDKWKAVSVYCYSTAGGEEVAWPGLPATVVDADKGVYSYDPGEFDRIIFNNGTDKTGNLVVE